MMSRESTKLLKKYKWYCKHVIYFLIFYSGILCLLIKLVKAKNSNHRAIILFYHRFREGGRGERLLPSLDIKEFEKQLIHLKKLYKFISMDELTDSIKNGKTFRLPCVVLTIDDGYLDNYMLAYPILCRHDIPALIYLTVGLIGTNNGLWIDDVEFGLLHAKVQSFSLEELLRNEVFNISTWHGKKKAEEILFARLRKLGNRERQNLIQKLFEILNVEKTIANKKARMMLNWDEIAEMLRNRISFGAHTVSHPFLPGLSLEEAKYEVKESKKILEKKLNESVRHFAVPNGKKEDFNDELYNFCKEIGFDTIVTTEPGSVCSNSDRFSLNRILPPPPLYYFACETAKHLFL